MLKTPSSRYITTSIAQQVGKWPIHVQVSHYAGVACKRLERIGFGGKKQPRKPSTEDIDQARVGAIGKT